MPIAKSPVGILPWLIHLIITLQKQSAFYKKLFSSDLKIITGIQEAQLISLARNTNMNVLHDYSLYIDVGGGSTELILISDGKLVDKIACPNILRSCTIDVSRTVHTHSIGSF